MLFFEPLERWARENPKKEAIVYADRRITYEEYNRKVDGVACGLLQLGIKKGDKVGIWIPNHPEFLYVYLACAKIGAAAVPVSIRFAAPEVNYVLFHSDSRVLIMEPGFGPSDFVEIFSGIRSNLPQLSHVVVLGGEEQAARIEGALAFDRFLQEGEGREDELMARKGEVHEDDTVLMLFTSGTTGRPKAPELTHRNIIRYLEGDVKVSDVNAEDRLLMNIPNNHVGGAVMAMAAVLYVGATLVMHDTFVPAEVLKTIQQERITIIGQVPAQFILEFMLPDFDSYDLSSVRIIVISGAPVPPELVLQIKEKFGVTPYVGYGLTETSGAITFTRPDDPLEKISTTIGVPNEGIEVKIKDPEGREVARGEAGEICLRGDAVMKGYYKQPEANAEAFNGEGFFHTGDMGFIDEDDYLHILGRKKEMYIRGGENVYPPEVEEVLFKHPKVLFAAVLGYPDPVLGEKGRAYIVPQPGMEVTEEEIREYCRKHLAEYKVPDQVVFRDELPLTPLGKVHKFLLYEEMRRELEK